MISEENDNPTGSSYVIRKKHPLWNLKFEGSIQWSVWTGWDLNPRPLRELNPYAV